MVSARRAGRWALYILGSIAILLIVAWVGIQVYFNSSAGKAFVARQITDQIGMPVKVEHVRLGVASSSIGLEVYDPEIKNRAQGQVLAVQDAEADVSLFDLATGDVSPSRVELHGVNLVLHVAADGEVITTLPKMPEGEGTAAVPAVDLRDGSITIRQEGRPEFVLHNLALSAEPEGDAVKLSGTLNDPVWSKWTLSGSMSRDASTGWVEVATPDAPLTMDRLESIPFVPPEVWKSIRPDGRAAATARVSTTSQGGMQYSLDIRPHGAELTLPDASVTLKNVTGDFRVTETQVQLTNAHADLAGGSVTVTGECDFGTEPIVVNLDVRGKNLDVRRFPAEWHFPKELEGKLSGHANLAVKIRADGSFEPSGGGEGVLTEVKALGFPADNVPIHLRQSGNQYEFYKPKKEAIRPPLELRDVALLLTLLQPPGATETQPEPKDDDTTTLDATIRLRDIDIAQLLERLKVKLGYRIAGRVSTEATIAVPLGEVTSRSSYRFAGKITSPALTLEGLTVRDVTAHMVYQNGAFTLTELAGKIDSPDGTGPPGKFRGTFTAATEPPGDVTASLAIDRIPVGEVLRAFPDLDLRAGGTVTGKVAMTAPYKQVSDPEQWTGSASLASDELIIEQRHAKDVRFAARVEQGKVSLTEGALTLEGIPITAEAQLGLAGKYPFSAVVQTKGTQATDLQKLVPEVEFAGPVEGAVDSESRVTGTLSPLAFTATGHITASKLILGKSTANRIDAKWQLTEDRFTVSSLTADAFGGTVTGSAQVPLAAEKSGAFEVVFKTLDAAAATRLVADFPVKVTGQVSGKVAGAIAPPKPGESRIGTLDVDLTAPKLTVQGFPAERLVGKVVIKNGAIGYAFEGKSLDGSFDIKGRYPGRKGKKPAVPEKSERGSLQLTGIDLSQLASKIGFTSLSPLKGRLDASFSFANDFSSGNGRVVLTRLQWGREVVAEELTGVLLLSDGIVQLTEMTGRLAGGELRLRGRVRLDSTGRNFFTLTLRGAEAKRLLAPLTDSSNLIEGPMTVVAHARLGGETRGVGTLTLPRGSVAGVAITGLRVPFEFATTPYGYGRFSVREASVNAGSGRARGQFTMDWGYTARVDGQIRFNNVPLRTLSPGLGENALLGNGRITGRFDLGGLNVRSVNDLTGTLLARLNNTSVREIPILQQVTPFLNTYGLTRPFDSGDIRAVLRQGVFHVQRLALANPASQIFAEGTIATTGRVDLTVVAHTGTIGPEVRALRIFGLGPPAFGPIPLTLLRDVSDFLSNRTIRLSVTGQISNPIVRVDARALLTDQAVRFFLGRYVLPADVSGALGLGTGRSSNRK